MVLKSNVTLAKLQKFLSDDRRFYLQDSKLNVRSDVDGLAHTKQLLNLFCILTVYIKHADTESYRISKSIL